MESMRVESAFRLNRWASPLIPVMGDVFTSISSSWKSVLATDFRKSDMGLSRPLVRYRRAVGNSAFKVGWSMTRRLNCDTALSASTDSWLTRGW